MKVQNLNKNFLARSIIWAALLLIFIYEIIFGVMLYRRLSAAQGIGTVKHAQLINQPILKQAVDRYGAAQNYSPPAGQKIANPFR